MSYYEKEKISRMKIGSAVGISIILILSTFTLVSMGEKDDIKTIRINEIMYDPLGSDSGREWIEICNTAPYSINISEWRLFEQGVNHSITLINGSMEIPLHGFAILADNYQKFLLDYPGYSGILIDSSFSLSNTGEYIAIKNDMLEIIDEVTYVPQSGANGTGMSLEYKGNNIWKVSLIDGGTPGAPNSVWKPPLKPTDPKPANNSENVSINPLLSVIVTDPDNDTMNVTFYNASDDSIIGTAANISNGTRANVTWPNLAYNTTYSWYAVANDSVYETRSDIWNFTTMMKNHPPYEPSNPAPEDEAENVSIETSLNWIGGDPDPDDTVLYDIYFGTMSPPLLEKSNHSETTYEFAADLDYETTYFWMIVAKDNHNATNESEIWTFTTREEPGPKELTVEIIKPAEKTFYFQGEDTFSLLINTIIYGSLDIEAEVIADGEIEKVVFFINGSVRKFKKEFGSEDSYIYENWGPLLSGFYTIRVVAYDEFGNNASDEIRVFKWRAHPVILLAGSLVIIKQLRSGTPFQWTILRGTVLNLRQMGTKFNGRAIILHYREIAPLTSMASSGSIRLRKITFSRSPFMLSHDVGPLGLTTYLFGIIPGKINTIVK
jgi:hypothetical protein